MHELIKPTGPQIQNAPPENTETSTNLREFLVTIHRSCENPQLWPSEFRITHWSKVRRDQPMRSSVYAAAHKEQPEEGEAYMIKLTDQSAILVEQGSCVFVPTTSARIVASLGFSRCVAYSHRTQQGLFFAHVTEHDETLFALRERVLLLYGPGTEQVYLPELQTKQSGLVSAKAKADLNKLKVRLHEKRIDITPYPWSDFPPTSDSTEYSSGIIVGSNNAQIIPLITQEADSKGNPIYQLDPQKDVISF